jgi:hypothetical protein
MAIRRGVEKEVGVAATCAAAGGVVRNALRTRSNSERSRGARAMREWCGISAPPAEGCNAGGLAAGSARTACGPGRGGSRAIIPVGQIILSVQVSDSMVCGQA